MKTFKEYVNEAVKPSIKTRNSGIDVYDGELDDSFHIAPVLKIQGNVFTMVGYTTSMQDFGDGYDANQIKIFKKHSSLFDKTIAILENTYTKNLDLFKKYKLNLVKTQPSKYSSGYFMISDGEDSHMAKGTIIDDVKDLAKIKKIVEDLNSKILKSLLVLAK